MATKSMKPFTGSGLTVGSFAQYHESLYLEIVETTPVVLHIETLAPQYSEAIATLKNIIRRVSAFSETADVTKSDKERDALLSAFFHIFKGYQFVPAGDTSGLAAAAQALAPVISAYYGIQTHELNRETVEVQGMLAALSTDAMLAHIEKLGLKPLLMLLSTANRALESAISTRTADAATRAPQREVNTDQQRRLIVDLYNELVPIVNAYALTTGEAAIGKFIDKVNTLAEYYRNVQANTAKKKATTDGDAPEEAFAGEEEAGE